jgi:hypothetical protein
MSANATPAAQNAQSLRAANVARSRIARTAELKAVFGELLTDRRRMISVDEAVRLALRYGQKRLYAGYHAGFERARRQRTA